MNKTKILIVEDEAIVARDLTQQLDRLGYEPVADTPRGEDALDLVGRLRPDLVLMDIQLAGQLDGIQTAVAIRERCEVPVVFLTAFADKSFLQRSKLAEPFGYIVKPFDERELYSAIEIGLHKHRAETQLRHSQQELAAILRTAMDGFWLCDLQGRILEVNEAACRIVGYTREELLRMELADLSTDSAEQITAHIDRIAQAGTSRFERQHRTKDGRLIDVEVSVNYLATSGGRMVAFLRDITERKRLEAQLRQAQKMEAVGQLAGGVAHDFNNILAAIALHVGLLREAEGLDPETRGALRELEKEAARGAGLTRQLLSFSRQRPMAVVPLALNELVENLLKMLRRVLGERIAVELHAQPDLPAVEGDVGMLEQVVVNLCVNARDAMPAGGRLVLRTESVTIDDQAAGANLGAHPGQFVRFSVADSGSGIDPAIVGRIFEPFFTTKDVGQGTGLGLSIVHGIVKQHGGWVEVESAVGKGSTFRVLLPAKLLPSAAPTEAESVEFPHGHNELVLTVEDEESVRVVLAVTLRRHGYRVLLAKNGPEAVELWNQHRAAIDVLLTDMMLPGGMSGADIARRLHADRPELPVIVSSGYTGDKDHEPVPNAITLPKPYEVHSLLGALRQCLERRPAPPPTG